MPNYIRSTNWRTVTGSKYSRLRYVRGNPFIRSTNWRTVTGSKYSRLRCVRGNLIIRSANRRPVPRPKRGLNSPEYDVELAA
jgi:hypothetical protein